MFKRIYMSNYRSLLIDHLVFMIVMSIMNKSNKSNKSMNIKDKIKKLTSSRFKKDHNKSDQYQLISSNNHQYQPITSNSQNPTTIQSILHFTYLVLSSSQLFLRFMILMIIFSSTIIIISYYLTQILLQLSNNIKWFILGGNNIRTWMDLMRRII